MIIEVKLKRSVRKRQPGLLQSGFTFYHDNAPVHFVRMVTELLDEYEWSVSEHPSFPPDLAPCEFWLFPERNNIFVVAYLSQEKTLFSRRSKPSGKWTKTPISPPLTADYGECKSALTMAVVTMRKAWNENILCL
ncbi:histone-lysine N-methyltransferase SETMAR [Plakobranchus ocellatus]|uniref:Histone-lysine N-methyltransferase SETMAR n=1 Tax=Plakobranchus ocellatus TaxID=259542 RepID=A0AAV4BXW5_9GAST|nr:histone-lysine N-methyltransferase SETMAR [Plakobranchus ocellatus]